MKSGLLLLGLLAACSHASTVGDIWNGFILGLQQYPQDPSPCIESQKPLVENWGNFTQAIETDWILAIDELRDSSAGLNDLIAKCAIVDAYELIKRSFTAEGSGELLVKVSLGYSFYSTQLNALYSALQSKTYPAVGKAAGEIFRALYAFGI